MEKSWLEVEMDETMDLLRKRLEAVNNKHSDDLDDDDISELERIYHTMHHIICCKQAMGLKI